MTRARVASILREWFREQNTLHLIPRPPKAHKADCTHGFGIEVLSQDALSTIFTHLLSNGDQMGWCALSATCKFAFRVAKLGGEDASRKAAAVLCMEANPARPPTVFPSAPCFPNAFKMCRGKCDQCINLLKMSGEPVAREQVALNALPGWHSPEHEVDNRRHSLERHLGAAPVDGSNAKRTSLPSKWTTVKQIEAAAPTGGDDAPMARVLLAAVGDFCSRRPSTSMGVKQVASRVEDAHSLIVAYAATYPADDCTHAFRLVETMLQCPQRQRNTARWAWFTLAVAEKRPEPQLILRLPTVRRGQAAQLCFCGSGRHLPFECNELPFGGLWVVCDVCKRECHAECTGLTEAHEAEARRYCCPMCNDGGLLGFVDAVRVELRRQKEAEMVREATAADQLMTRATFARRIKELVSVMFARVPELRALDKEGVVNLKQMLLSVLYFHFYQGREAPSHHAPPPGLLANTLGEAFFPEQFRRAMSDWVRRSSMSRRMDEAWEELMLEGNAAGTRLLGFLVDGSSRGASCMPPPLLDADDGLAATFASAALALMKPGLEAAIEAHDKKEVEQAEQAKAAAAQSTRVKQQEEENRRREQVRAEEEARQQEQRRSDEMELEALEREHADQIDQGRRKRRRMRSLVLDAIGGI